MLKAGRSLFFALAVLSTGTPPVMAKDTQPLVGQASIVDGDTLEIHGTRIRLWGIDAPESSQRCTAPDGRQWRCGAAAANRLAEFVGNRTVSCRPRDTDRYGRLIAACSVGNQDLGRWVVENGWAFAFSRYSRDYVSDEARALAARRGIHAGACQRPWEYRAQKRDQGRKPWE